MTGGLMRAVTYGASDALLMEEIRKLEENKCKLKQSHRILYLISTMAFFVPFIIFLTYC